MQIVNPDYKFYKMLAGNWRNDNGSCRATLTTGQNFEINYDGGSLSWGYGVLQTGPCADVTGYNPMGMAALLYQRHEGEELKLTLDGAVLTNGDQEVYRIDAAWYGASKIHLELTDLCGGQKRNLTLMREEDAARIFGATGSDFRCECGYVGPIRKFCPNCGKATGVYVCECGFHSVGAKFCTNCGKPIPLKG